MRRRQAKKNLKRIGCWPPDFSRAFVWEGQLATAGPSEHRALVNAMARWLKSDKQTAREWLPLAVFKLAA